jgi:hypothetical protein
MTLNYNQGYFHSFYVQTIKTKLLWNHVDLISDLHFDVFEGFRDVFVIFMRFNFDNFTGITFAFNLMRRFTMSS